MNLLITKYNIEVELKENRVNILTIEKSSVFAETLRDIWIQTNGEIGYSVLTDKEKELKISREVEVIFNIFNLDCNDKKIITKVYQDLILNANEILCEKLLETNSVITNLIDDVIQTVPYALTQNLEIDLGGLLKLYGVKIDCESETTAENVINYIKLVHQILNKKIFVFVNLKQFLDEKELKALYEASFYEKVFILIIEGYDSGHLENEIHQILDNDLCLIQY